MEAEVTKEPVKNIKSAISFWNKQDTDNEPNISQNTKKPFVPISRDARSLTPVAPTLRDARSPTPPPVAPKPKMNVTPLRDARPPNPPPPVPPRPKTKKRDAASAPSVFKPKESILDKPWQTDNPHRLLALDGMDKEPPDIVDRTSRNLSATDGTIWKSPDTTGMSTEPYGTDGTIWNPENDEASKEPPKTDASTKVLLKRNEIPMNLPSKDGILQNPPGTDAVPNALLRTPKEDPHIVLLEEINTGDLKAAAPVLKGLEPGPHGINPMEGAAAANEETGNGGGASASENQTLGGTTAKNTSVDAERSPMKSIFVSNPSIEDGSLTFRKTTSIGSMDAKTDVKSSLIVGLGTLDLSMDEPKPDVDLSPNIREYEERLKESFRKARLRKASPQPKRKDLTKPPRPRPKEPCALLEAQSLWESCLKDDTRAARREYGKKYLERDSARQLIAPKKLEVAEIASKKPEVAEIASKKPEVAEIASKKPEIVSKKPEVVEIASKKPEIASKKPKVVEIASKKPEVAEIASKKPVVASKKPKVAEIVSQKPVVANIVSKKPVVASKKPEVAERFKRENFTERDVGSIANKISYFHSKAGNTDQSNRPISAGTLIESIEKRLKYGSTTFTQTYFQRSRYETNTEESKQCSSGGIQFNSSSYKEEPRKSETLFKLENRSCVLPEKRKSIFQTIPVRFSPVACPQPKRWKFVDALSVPASEDASTSSSADSNGLPSTSTSDQPSMPGEMGEQGTSFGSCDENPSSASRSVSDDSSTEESDEEATEGAESGALVRATGRQGIKSKMSPAGRAPMTSRSSRRKSQLAKSHIKSSQSPNGGHRRLKKSRSLENLYKLYHHLVVPAQNRPVQGDDVEGVDALIQSAGDNMLDEPEATESEPELQEPQPVPRRLIAPRFWIRRNLLLDLFVVSCCVLVSYSVLITYLAGIVPKNDFTYRDFDDDYWGL